MAELFSDNFDDNDLTANPVWNVASQGAITNTNGYVTVPVSAANPNDGVFIDHANLTEVWWNMTVYVVSQSSANNQYIQGFGLKTDTTSKAAIVGFSNDNGTIRWFLTYNPDAGQTQVEAGTVALATPYDVEMHWVASSGPGANDGTIEMWVNTVKVFDESGIDNDTIDAGTFQLGNNFRSGMNITFRVDDLWLGDTQKPVGGGGGGNMMLLGVG